MIGFGKTISLLILALLILISGCKDSYGPGETGTFTDTRDNLNYAWVRIGSQIWMAENLGYLPAVSPPDEGGSQIPFYYVQGFTGNEVADAIRTEIYGQYGVLYNWKAMQTACPAGWHLPSDEEWKDLERNLGMDMTEEDETGNRISGEAGKKIKSATGWVEEGNGNNKSGFNALPGGSRNSTGEFGSIGMRAGFRTSTASGSSGNISRSLDYNSDGINRGTVNHSIGFSVRCVKNN